MSGKISTSPYWRVDSVPERVPRRVLMLPGVGYSCDRPLLSWCSAIAHQRGWWVQRAWWTVRPESNNDAFVSAALTRLDHDAPDADTTLVIAKSMGSRAAAASSRRRWAGVWLTPLLTDPVVREALLGYRGDCLLVGGDADRHWSPPSGRVDETLTAQRSPGSAVAGLARLGAVEDDGSSEVTPAHPEVSSSGRSGARLRQSWVQVTGANHSLEIPGDWRASVQVQRAVFGIVDDFLGRLGG
ncbi:MAG: hypothetical protein WAX29_09855 [Propionibacterium sp.]